MPINFEALLSSADTNNTFVDKTIDDTKTGKLALQKNVGDPTAISDLQVYINFLASVLGVNGEADPNANVYSSNNYINDGDDRKVVIGDIDAAIKVIEDALNAFIATKGVALGLAELDATGRLPSSQLSLDSVELKGTFDPNTDTLTNGTGTNGDYYIVSADGSYDFGAGSVSMLQNDSIIYFDSTATYERLSGSQVRSVNGSTGDITIDKASLGLDQVTNDAQLKRAGADFNTFTVKAEPVDADIVLIEDSEDSFNKKKVELANLIGGGGSGGSTAWIYGDISPLSEFANGLDVYSFDNVSPQELFLNVVVPDSYKTGDQIQLVNSKCFIDNATDNLLFRCETTLIQDGDSFDTTTNQHTSTNTELVLSSSNVLLNVGNIDLTDGTGNINGVAVDVGDILKIRLYRDFANELTSAPEDGKFLRYSASVSFKP
jgi:hypothetical protein